MASGSQMTETVACFAAKTCDCVFKETAPTMPNITIATWSDEDRVAAAMTLAFATDPVERWALPDPHQYMSTFPPYVILYGGRAFDHGSAYVIGDFSGVALWLPPGVEPDYDPMTALFLENVEESILAIANTLFEQMASFHPEEPHWYLSLMGVDPAYQGRGYGSSLLRHALAVCDKDQLPAYLEATSPANLSLYERHGFQTLGRIESESSPPMFPMLRAPR
jgi:GNAT superfamily N-acetyltransferase